MSKFSILILTIGIPGSGKTTWVKDYMKTHPLTYVISTDAIRKELTGVEQCVDPSQNSMIHDEARKRVKEILLDPQSKGGLGPEIIVDSTNCEVEEWIKYKELGPSIIATQIFNLNPDEAFERMRNRERKVPLEILQQKWKQFKENEKFLPLIFNFIDYHHL